MSLRSWIRFSSALRDSSLIDIFRSRIKNIRFHPRSKPIFARGGSRLLVATSERALLLALDAAQDGARRLPFPRWPEAPTQAFLDQC